RAHLRPPYDSIAREWARGRKLLERERPYFERFAAMLAPGAHVLDLGCGSGVPARFLLDRGFALTGVDGSLELLKLARGRCPEARLVAADLVALPVRGRYRGAVAWDSFFHVGRAVHEQLFRDV